MCLCVCVRVREREREKEINGVAPKVLVQFAKPRRPLHSGSESCF